MIRIVNGNLLDASEVIIAHQANCKGSMGAGVAKQIRDRWPEIFTDYVTFCSMHGRSGRELLGQIHSSYAFDRDGMPIEVCHLFGQDGYSGSGQNTNYSALETALLKLRHYVEASGGSIALPYKMGCGLGGGDWDDVVYPMIERIFGESNVLVSIYRLEEN